MFVGVGSVIDNYQTSLILHDSIFKLEVPGGSESQGSYFGSMSSEKVATGPAK